MNVLCLPCSHLKDGGAAPLLLTMCDGTNVALCVDCADPNEAYINADAIWRQYLKGDK